MIIRNLLCISLFSAVLLLSSQTVLADDESEGSMGTTNISIELPDLIILHYYSGLTLNFEEFSSTKDRGTAEFDVQWSGDTESSSKITDENTELDLPDFVSLQLPNV